jgi:3-hydroxyisobutyrate dehydrogenase-like beta-hydroxyacid dehydrogenase
VRGYDIDPARISDFVSIGGVAASSPADAAAGCETVVLSLLTSDIVRSVCLGPGGLAEAGGPRLVLDTTTGPAEDAMAIAQDLEAHGIEYADMTISGNAAVAGRGELVVMLGGTSDAYERARPIMEAIGRSHHHVGPVGSGARMKLIVNHVLAINRSALAEALVVAEKSGLDLVRALDILRDSAAYSRAMDLWGDRMVAAAHLNPNARLRQSHKDSVLMVAQAEAAGVPGDYIRLVEATLHEGVDNGLADLDNSSTIEVIRRRSGVGRIPIVKESV